MENHCPLVLRLLHATHTIKEGQVRNAYNNKIHVDQFLRFQGIGIGLVGCQLTATFLQKMAGKIVAV